MRRVLREGEDEGDGVAVDGDELGNSVAVGS
jgi:hypothetical protein